MSKDFIDNAEMSAEWWKEAVKVASDDTNCRRENGYTETRDDYFVDGVQWADEHQQNIWHDVKELPTREEWLLMADDKGYYMAGLWVNDGKGFEGIGEIHVGPFKFKVSMGLEGDVVRWCYINDIERKKRHG